MGHHSAAEHDVEGWHRRRQLLSARKVTSHVAQNTSAERSVIDQRTTWQPPYVISQPIRKRIVCLGGWRAYWLIGLIISPTYQPKVSGFQRNVAVTTDLPVLD